MNSDPNYSFGLGMGACTERLKRGKIIILLLVLHECEIQIENI